MWPEVVQAGDSRLVGLSRPDRGQIALAWNGLSESVTGFGEGFPLSVKSQHRSEGHPISPGPLPAPKCGFCGFV